MSATKPQSGYDDRFVVPLEPSRRGAHRARVSPVVGALPVVAVVAVVAVVILLAWTLFGRSTGTSTQAGPAAATSGAVAQPGQPTQPVAAAPEATASASVPAEPTESAAVTAEPTQAVDRTMPIAVMNSSGISGLARRVATTLKGDGWTINGTPGNVTPARPTTVYYATAAQKATAQEVLKALGGTYRLRQSATEAAAGITVVLGTDYRS